MQNLMIIESPNKIKKLKSILGSNWDVKATVGHFRELSSKGEANVGVDSNFNPDFVISKDKQSVWNNVKKGIENYDKIYLASDPDREGEAISWHVYNSLPKNIQSKCVRVTFNEITPSAVKEAIKHPRDIDMGLVKAQFLRQIGDKLIGYKGSRAVQNVAGVKSTGRVQGVALKLLIDKENEIANYKEIRKDRFKAIIKDDNGVNVSLLNVDENLKPITYELGAKTPNVGKDFVLSDIKTSSLSTTPPYKPFITSTLLKKGISVGLNAKSTQKAMQVLFENGLITYPRTDSYALSEEFAHQLIDYLKKDGQKTKNSVAHFKNGVGSQGAHECIRITHLETKPDDKKIASLGKEAQKVYKLVYDYTYIQGLEDASYKNTDFVFKDEFGNHFMTTSKQYDNLGWKKYFNITDEQVYAFSKGKTYNGKVEKENFVSNPKPSPYNEASLIATLEKLEIGRPSTYASYINILKDRDYATIGAKSVITSNDNGKAAYKANEKILSDFVNVDFTAKVFEKMCDEVEKGNVTYNEVLKQWNKALDKVLEKAQDPNNKVENLAKKSNQMELSDKFCEKCQKNRIKVKTQSGKTYYKCENSKYNPKTKTWSGCDIEWDNSLDTSFKKKPNANKGYSREM